MTQAFIPTQRDDRGKERNEDTKHLQPERYNRDFENGERLPDYHDKCVHSDHRLYRLALQLACATVPRGFLIFHGIRFGELPHDDSTRHCRH